MPKQQTNVRERTNTKLREPRRFMVVLYNDDFTTMDFVVRMLMSVFHKSESDAGQLMFEVHRTGSAIVGAYSYDVAMTRVQMATRMARAEGFPLRLECKPE